MDSDVSIDSFYIFLFQNRLVFYEDYFKIIKHLFRQEGSSILNVRRPFKANKSKWANFVLLVSL